MTVPPVPAAAIITSTFPDDGLDDVDGVDTTASIISGPVVNSCAKGLLTFGTKDDYTSTIIKNDRRTFRY